MFSKRIQMLSKIVSVNQPPKDVCVSACKKEKYIQCLFMTRSKLIVLLAGSLLNVTKYLCTLFASLYKSTLNFVMARVKYVINIYIQCIESC